MSLIRWMCVLAATVWGLSAEGSQDRAPRVVMPFGDSITESPQYRKALWKRAVDAGVELDFVGSRRKGEMSYKGRSFDSDHEGFWGINAHALHIRDGGLPKRLETLSKGMGGRKIDAVIYHIGTNDANGHKDFETGKKYLYGRTRRFMEDSIRAFQAHNPKIRILLCKIIPVKNGQTQRARLVEAHNEQIPDIARMTSTPTSRVVVVDLFTGFDAAKGKGTYDGIHPSDAGGEEMADRMFQALFDRK